VGTRERAGRRVHRGLLGRRRREVGRPARRLAAVRLTAGDLIDVRRRYAGWR
jgi:hypothetical protein